MSSLPVHLKGQSRSCGATTVGPSASNVFVNNIPVSLQDDTNSHGAGGLISGQGTVFANNKLVIRQSDNARPDNHVLIPHGNPSASAGAPKTYCGNNTG